MQGLHILKGTGDNCTCSDCVVLYGGECYTTPINDTLDAIEKELLTYLYTTPTGREKKKSSYAIESAIDAVVMPAIRKLTGMSKAEFNLGYYCWLPMLFMMRTSYTGADVRSGYRFARWLLYCDITKHYSGQGVKKL